MGLAEIDERRNQTKDEVETPVQRNTADVVDTGRALWHLWP